MFLGGEFLREGLVALANVAAALARPVQALDGLVPVRVLNKVRLVPDVFSSALILKRFINSILKMRSKTHLDEILPFLISEKYLKKFSDIENCQSKHVFKETNTTKCFSK